MRSFSKPTKGFTLIELLVVIVIIGIIAASAVSLIIRDRTQEHLDTEAKRLIALIGLAKDEAVLQSRELGIYFDRDRYTFYQLQPETGQWQPISNDKMFRQRKLTHDIRMELILEEQATLFTDPSEAFTLESSIEKEGDEENEKDEKKELPKPQVYILSSSEVSPFQLILTVGSDYQVTIKSDALGKLEIVDPDKI